MMFRQQPYVYQQPIYNQPIGQPISQPMQEPMMRPQYQPAPQMPAYQPQPQQPQNQSIIWVPTKKFTNKFIKYLDNYENVRIMKSTNGCNKPATKELPLSIRREKMLLENIKKLCASRNISLSALEKTLGFGNSTIAKWADCSPTVEKLSLVADYFGVSVDSLLQKPGKRRDTKFH